MPSKERKRPGDDEAPRPAGSRVIRVFHSERVLTKTHFSQKLKYRYMARTSPKVPPVKI